MTFVLLTNKSLSLSLFPSGSAVCGAAVCCSSLPADRVTQSSLRRVQRILRSAATQLRAALRSKSAALKGQLKFLIFSTSNFPDVLQLIFSVTAKAS